MTDWLESRPWFQRTNDMTHLHSFQVMELSGFLDGLMQIILLAGRQSIDTFCVDMQYVFNKQHQHCDAVIVLLRLKCDVLPMEGV